jgi:hypothetical protein
MVPPVVDQVTPVSEVPETVAVNCLLSPENSVADVGEMATDTGGVIFRVTGILNGELFTVWFALLAPPVTTILPL